MSFDLTEIRVGNDFYAGYLCLEEKQSKKKERKIKDSDKEKKIESKKLNKKKRYNK